MSQPDWKLTHALGDLGNIFEDATGVYAPEMDYFAEDDEGGALVFRIILDRVSLLRPDEEDEREETMCVPFGFPGRTDLRGPVSCYREWYCDSLDDVARSVGRSADDIRESLASEDVKRRAYAYMDIGGYFGFYNFDHEPEPRGET